jgi:hypothetical protein
VTWAQGNSADLPGDFGRFLLVTMGRSFHWMDREQVLTALDAIVDHDGAVVLANDSCLVRPNSPWQQAVEDIQHRFLPPDSVRPTPLPGRMNSPADHQPHEQILARSAFRHVDRRVYEFERPRAVDQVISYLYSTRCRFAAYWATGSRRSNRKSPTHCIRSVITDCSSNRSLWKS